VKKLSLRRFRPLISVSVLVLIFYTTGLKEITWFFWFLVFSAASIADIISTLFDTYYLSNGDWSNEKNPIIQKLGPHIGFLKTFILKNSLLLLIVFILGLLIGWFSVIRCMFFILSVVRFHAALHNFLLSKVDIPDIFGNSD